MIVAKIKKMKRNVADFHVSNFLKGCIVEYKATLKNQQEADVMYSLTSFKKKIYFSLLTFS